MQAIIEEEKDHITSKCAAKTHHSDKGGIPAQEQMSARPTHAPDGVKLRDETTDFHSLSDQVGEARRWSVYNLFVTVQET